MISNFKWSALLLPLLLTQACDQTREVTETMPSGLVETYQVDEKSGKKSGTYKMYSSEEILLEESQYKDDYLHGPRIVYYFDGSGKELEEIYEEGYLNGPYKGYYRSGTLKYEGYYRDHEMDSIWTFYHPNGQVKEKVMYQSNLENGPFEEYYKNGELKARGTYAGGDNEDSWLFLYDSLGAPARVMMCDTGVCRTQWTPDSLKKMPEHEF